MSLDDLGDRWFFETESHIFRLTFWTPKKWQLAVRIDPPSKWYWGISLPSVSFDYQKLSF
jgi:hypothetical protein